MTLTLDLSPETEQTLQEDADRSGVTLQQLVSEIIERAARDRKGGYPKTGAELVELLEADGVIGAWADRKDIENGIEFAHRLRQQSNHRDWSN